MHTTLRTNVSKLILSLAVLLFAAGCATETKKADAEKPKENKDDYVWVTPTGSRIPVKVKKGTSASTVANEKGQEEMSNQQRMQNEAKYFPTDR